MDGTQVLNASGQPIATYNNTDIAEYAKVFTGLSWADHHLQLKCSQWYQLYPAMIMFNGSHETG